MTWFLNSIPVGLCLFVWCSALLRFNILRYLSILYFNLTQRNLLRSVSGVNYARTPFNEHSSCETSLSSGEITPRLLVLSPKHCLNNPQCRCCQGIVLKFKPNNNSVSLNVQTIAIKSTALICIEALFS